MRTAEEVEIESTPIAKRMIIIILLTILSILITFYSSNNAIMLTPTAIIIVVALVLLNILAIQLIRTGAGNIPVIPLLAGVFFICGGALFDIAITIYKTPDLAYEANPVVRAFINNGVSIRSIYIYSAIGQLLGNLFYCLGWAAILKHRTT